MVKCCSFVACVGETGISDEPVCSRLIRPETASPPEGGDRKEALPLGRFGTSVARSGALSGTGTLRSNWTSVTDSGGMIWV